MVSQGVVDALVAAGHEVRVVGYRRPSDDSPGAPGEVCAGRRPIETAEAGRLALAWMARALGTRRPFSSAKYASRAYVRSARAASAGADAAIIDHAQVHFAAGALDSRLPVVFVAHNVESGVYAALAAEAQGRVRRWINRREARSIGAAEQRLAVRATQVWTLTADDASDFRAARPAADVRTLEVASAVEAPAVEAEVAYDVALLGTWTWRPNAAGLDWFAEEVVPLLPADTRIAVAGAGADGLRRTRAGLDVMGIVPDASEFLARARVIAVPATTGGGVQVKTLDAIASGVPVVASRAATRGLGELPPSVAVESSARGFADALMRLQSTDRATARAESLAWSAARRARFERTVADSIAELVESAR